MWIVFFFFLLAGIKRNDLRARWWPEGIRFVGTAFKCCCCCYHFVLLFFFFFSPRCCVCSLYSLPYLSLSLSLCSVYLFYYIVHLLFPFLYYTTTPVISSSCEPPNRKKKQKKQKQNSFTFQVVVVVYNFVWAFAGLAGGLYSNDCVELEESYRNDRAAIEKKKKKKQKQRVFFRRDDTLTGSAISSGRDDSTGSGPSRTHDNNRS